MTWPLQTDQGIPVAKVELTAIDIGWLIGGLVWERAMELDPIARSLYIRLKAAAIDCGVEWRYGDPWFEAGDTPAGGSEPQGGGR